MFHVSYNSFMNHTYPIIISLILIKLANFNPMSLNSDRKSNKLTIGMKIFDLGVILFFVAQFVEGDFIF